MISVEDLDIDEEEKLSHLTSRTLLLKRSEIPIKKEEENKVL